VSELPPVTLVLEDGQGNQEIHPLPGPGGEIRVSVGKPGRHGAVWKIWAGREKLDVYVAIRSIGGYQKVSWHPNSEGKDWWFQWTSEHIQANPQITQRLIDQWSQPPEIGESGWAKGFSMWTRHQDVVPAPDNEPLPADLLWVPPPPEGYATGLHVVIARPQELSQGSVGELRWIAMNGPFLGGFSLSDRRVVLLVASSNLVTTALNDEIKAAFAKFEPALRDADQVRTRTQGPGVHRMLVWGTGPDGERQAWDVAVELPANAPGQDDAPT
jgi:hypothetical protein